MEMDGWVDGWRQILRKKSGFNDRDGDDDHGDEFKRYLSIYIAGVCRLRLMIIMIIIILHNLMMIMMIGMSKKQRMEKISFDILTQKGTQLNHYSEYFAVF